MTVLQRSTLRRVARLISISSPWPDCPRLLRRRRVSQNPVRPRDVVPLAELPAHGLEDSDRLEADAPVPWKAAVVRQRDARIGVAEALLSQDFEQPQIERAADAPALLARVHIGRHLDRPAVARTRTIRRPIRVANDLTVSLRNEPFPACQ